MKKYIIKKNGLNEYVPGILLNDDIDSFWTWVRCSCRSLEEAKEIIEGYKRARMTQSLRNKIEIVYSEDILED